MLAAGALASVPAVTRTAPAAAAATYDHTYTIGCGAQGVTDLLNAFKDIGGYWSYDELQSGHRLAQNGERDHIVLADDCTYDFTGAFDGASALPSLGGGYYATTVRVTIDGNGSTFARTGSARYRFLAVQNTSSELTVNDLTLSGGAAPHGAGIHADPFMTELCGPLGGISGCSDANADDGGNGGAIASVGTLRLNDVTFIGNAAGTGHQGYSNNPRSTGGAGGAGGAVYGSPGSWVIVDGSTFTGNRAGAGGQGADSGRPFAAAGNGGNGGDGGAIGAFGHLEVTNSTFRTNVAGGPGSSGTNLLGMGSVGGMYGDGAAVAISGAAATIDASSFIDNGNLGGRGGAVAAHSAVTITNSTFQHNGASYGGAISNVATTVNVRNSVFVDNYSDNTGDVIAGAYGGTIDLANSVIKVSSGSTRAPCSATTAGYADDGAHANEPLTYTLHSNFGDLTDGGACTAAATGGSGLPSSPALNGGTTPSFAPSADSPLLDAGDPAYCPTHDQRGLPRDTSDGGCDIGSVDHFTWPTTTLTGPVLDPAWVAANGGNPNGYKGITQDYALKYFFSAPVITDPAARYRLTVFSNGVQHEYDEDKNGDPLRDLSLLPVSFSEAGPASAELWVGAVDQWLKVATATPFRVLRSASTAPTLSVSMDGGAAKPRLNAVVDEFSTHHYVVTVTDPDEDASWSFAQAPSCGAQATLSELTVAAHSFAFDCTFGSGGAGVGSQLTATVVDDQFDKSGSPIVGFMTVTDQPTQFGTLTGPGRIPIDTIAHYTFTIRDGHDDLVALAADPTWTIVCGRHLTGPTNTQTSVDGTTLTTTFDCTSDGTGLNSFNRLVLQDGVIVSNDATSVVFNPDGSGPSSVTHTHPVAFNVVSQVTADINRVYEIGTGNPNTAGNVRLGPINHPTASDIAHTRIDWGDGTVDTVDGWPGSTGDWATFTHPYATGGKHTVTVSVDLNADPGTWISVVTSDVWDYDSATPVLSLPDAITLSNAVPGQSDRVHYTASVTDPINGRYAATCSVADGATVPVGTTTVHCSATGNGQTVTGTFEVSVRDLQPPVVGTPTITQDKRGDGVHVGLDVPFTDDAPATGKAVCDPADDSVFAQGTTLVVCTATDAAGNTAKISFAVAVADGTGPVLNVPSSALGTSPDGSGVPVSFSATATSATGAALTPSCAPASGSVFPPGTSTVSCSATDAAGNVTVASFPVVVSGGTVATWGDLSQQFQRGGGIVQARRTVTVKLGADLTAAADSDGVGDQLQLRSDDDATLDLAGHDLSIDAPFGLPAIGVPADADLRVIDSIGGGRLTLTAHAGAAAIGGGICQSAGDVAIDGVSGSAVSYADGQMTGAAGIGSGAAPDAATLANWGGAVDIPGDCAASLDGGTVRFTGASYSGAPTTVSAPDSAVGAAITWTEPTGGATPTRLSTIHVDDESDGIAFAPSGLLTVDLQGGTSTDTAPGGPLTNPDHVQLTEPTRLGYVFGGWRKGSATGPAWSYTSETASTDPESRTSFTIYASWIPLAAGDCHSFVTGCQLVLQSDDDVVLDLRGRSWRLDGGSHGAGIDLPAGATLTVVDSVGGGQLDAVGGDGAAGIGGAVGQAAGTLVVRSGAVLATGTGGAGIGGGAGADGGTVTVSGGFLSTMSHSWSDGAAGAGVGAGDGGAAGGTLTIHGTEFADTESGYPTDTASGVDAPGAEISVESGAQEFEGASGPTVGLCNDASCTGFFVALGHPATFHLNGGDGGDYVNDGDTRLYEPSHRLLSYVEPTLTGSEFAGWYLDAALTDPVRARAWFDGPVHLYAKYAPAVPELIADTDPALDTDAPQFYGTQVAVTPPSFDTDDVTPHYEWVRCTRIAPISCASIAGAADKPTYTPRLADLDRQLKVKVTATADGTAPYAWTSGTTRVVQTGKFVAGQAQYTNFGGPTVGQTLSIAFPTWNEKPQRIDYVWKRDGTPIADAPDAASYVARAADLGATISVAVTAHGDGYDNWTFTATASNAVANGILTDAPQPTIAITAPPGSSDTTHALIGSKLTAVRGDWPSETTFDYQWYVNDGSGEVEVDGATSSTYIVPSGSTHDYLSVRVTGTAPGYQPKTMISDALRVPALDVELPRLQVDASSGSCTGLTSQDALALGQVVCAVVPDLPAGTTLGSYQWFRDEDSVVSVLGGNRYYLDSADVGHTITVTVTATAPGYDPVTVTSAPGRAHVWPVLNKTAPELSGTAVVGKLLTVTNGTWTWLPQHWTYTWLRDGDVIGGAGGACSDGGNCAAVSSYALQPADAGHTITVDVEWRYDASDDSPREQALDGKAYATSNGVGPIALATQTAMPVPTISGPGKVGTTLTANPGTWDDGVTLHHQWKDGDTAVGTDTAQLTLTPTMNGHTITVTVTGHKDGYADATKKSTGITVTDGDLTATPTPTISGTGKVGTTLTATPGTWDDGVTLHYQWKDGDTAVGTDSAQLTLTPTMNGHTITVTVTGHKDGYADATKKSTGITVTDGDLTATPTPTISGPGKVGTTLTANPGTWDDGVTLHYQWKDGDTVLGADGPLGITADQLGRTLTLAVSGGRPGYTSVTKTATVTVEPGDLTPATPVISKAAPAVGDTISVEVGAWGPGAVHTTLQWYADGVPIADATSATLTVGPAQLDKSITVLVTGTETGYTARLMAAAATAKVKPGRITHSGSVAIRGKAKVGAKLVARPGSFKAGASKIALKYQWLANGAVIKKATRSTFKIGTAQRGKQLSVKITAAATGYASASLTSAKTKRVANRPVNR
ncbi:hypothetical protein GCM10023350_11040 [Nocardioides endophyticus]|uniref:HYR domain-containing protein n=1 Tax=Nocardioides endophyticus TaxID=1353775 RepID=A0ABP8YJJ2_9ACTN